MHISLFLLDSEGKEYRSHRQNRVSIQLLLGIDMLIHHAITNARQLNTSGGDIVPTLELETESTTPSPLLNLSIRRRQTLWRRTSVWPSFTKIRSWRNPATDCQLNQLMEITTDVQHVQQEQTTDENHQSSVFTIFFELTFFSKEEFFKIYLFPKTIWRFAFEWITIYSNPQLDRQYLVIWKSSLLLIKIR